MLFDEIVNGAYKKREYPALSFFYEEWSGTRPFQGLRVLVATPVFRNTLLEYRALIAGGAEVVVGVAGLASGEEGPGGDAGGVAGRDRADASAGVMDEGRIPVAGQESARISGIDVPAGLASGQPSGDDSPSGRSPSAGAEMPYDPGIVELLRANGIPVIGVQEALEMEARCAESGVRAFDLVLDCAGQFACLSPRFGFVELTRSGVQFYEGVEKPVYVADSGIVKRIETCLGTGEGYVRALRQLGYGSRIPGEFSRISGADVPAGSAGGHLSGEFSRISVLKTSGVVAGSDCAGADVPASSAGGQPSGEFSRISGIDVPAGSAGGHLSGQNLPSGSPAPEGTTDQARTSGLEFARIPVPDIAGDVSNSCRAGLDSGRDALNSGCAGLDSGRDAFDSGTDGAPFARKNFLVFGSGKVGQGIVLQLLREGAQVDVVTDTSRGSSAFLDANGVPVTDCNALDSVVSLVKQADFIVTATGVKGALDRPPLTQALLESGAVIANMGVEDEYGTDVPASRVLAEKKPLNFILEEPTHLKYIDASLALHAALGELLVNEARECIAGGRNARGSGEGGAVYGKEAGVSSQEVARVSSQEVAGSFKQEVAGVSHTISAGPMDPPEDLERRILGITMQDGLIGAEIAEMMGW